jgi:hypothetical protein
LARKRLYHEDRGLQVPMTLDHGPVTSRGKSAPGPDPRIRHRIQTGMFRPIRVEHTNCLQVAIKTHSFIGGREGDQEQVIIWCMEATVCFSPDIDRQSVSEVEIVRGLCQEDELHYPGNRRTKCPCILTPSDV